MKISPAPFRSTLLSVLLLLCTVLAMPALAQKKIGSLGGFPLWTAKKSPLAGPFIPGLNAALLLTEEQKAKLVAAREETLGNAELQKLGASIKQNPNATEADRAAATKAYDEARAQFKTRLETILTAEQRKLVADLSAVYEEVSAATGEAFRDRFAQLKGDKASAAEVYKEASAKTAKDFKARLEGLLSKDAWAALNQAEAEEIAAASVVKVKKP